MFIALGNILAGQFKKEAEQQKKQQEEASSDIPNIRQFADMSSIGNIANSLSSNINIPNISNLN